MAFFKQPTKPSCGEKIFFQLLWKEIWSYLQKNRTTIHFSNITSWHIFSKHIKTLIGKNLCTLTFTSTLSTKIKIWKHSTSPIMDDWMKKLWNRIGAVVGKALALHVTNQGLIPSTAWYHMVLQAHQELSISTSQDYYRCGYQTNKITNNLNLQRTCCIYAIQYYAVLRMNNRM